MYDRLGLVGTTMNAVVHGDLDAIALRLRCNSCCHTINSLCVRTDSVSLS